MGLGNKVEQIGCDALTLGNPECTPGSAKHNCLSKHHHDKAKCQKIPGDQSQFGKTFQDAGLPDPGQFTEELIRDAEEALIIGGIIIGAVIILPPLLSNV